MKTSHNIITVLLLLINQCFAQELPGAKQIALAHSDLSSSNDVFALFNNPAGMPQIKFREVGIYYSPAPFGVKELSNAFASYCEPTDFGSFSAGISIYGFELYKETNFAIGYGRKFAENFFIGVTSIYHNVSIKNYGSKGIFVFNIGSIFKLNNQIGLGFKLENLTRSKISNEPGDIPTVFWLGADLNFVNDFTFYTAIKKEINFNPSLRLGIEYSLLEFLKLRVGAANEPSTYSGGIGVLYEFVQADYAISSHPDLGMTHQFGLIIRFNKN